MTYKTLKNDFEREMLTTLILGLKLKRIDSTRAQKISKGVMEVLKKSQESSELINKVSILCQEFPEIIEGYLKIARKYEDEMVKERMPQIKAILSAEIVNFKSI